ncbi:Autophagy protein 7 [Trichoglossum hirsutum]|uniref:Ubiquitin-like modifier-activating enzyme ATG7 n=1 Tax=Trichoglossum hirsutum TaxID=265104 RepID=A0A9P8LB96_9PEZI|nr:Autophagy protein 7 [Trichoglossum hirsutum]
MRFAPFASDIELPFYTSLASLKIDHDRLDDSARRVLGLYEVRPNDPPEASCRMQVPKAYCRAEGIIKNVNTIEEYKALDRAEVLQRAGRTIWEAINDGSIYSCPSLLSSFSVISYAGLKDYKFTYWFAFPALHSDPPWTAVTSDDGNYVRRLSSQDTTNLVDKVETWQYRTKDARQRGFFLAKKAWLNSISALQGYETGFFDKVDPKDQFVCFVDPSNYAENPGWMLRNLLVLIRQRWKSNKVQILCYRDVHSRRELPRSIILDLTIDTSEEKKQEPSTDIAGKLPPMPKVTGWERNKDGKLTSKIASLSEQMDPQRLAEQASDLNLKLMKWRVAPDLDLEKIKNTKCLLLGAGTLGSYVARNLLVRDPSSYTSHFRKLEANTLRRHKGWGVRKITFVDNAKVSFSNPVRQPLFGFKDCLGGGVKKAQRASEALTEIFPGVDSAGHVLSVPMAGHPVIDEKKEKLDYDTLKELVDDHDVLFLLMDTRESRWLPTVMGKSEGKIVLNAALGFDTFVVMRHGVRMEQGKGEELGCYFCNDVVAPMDSVKDATLDQQCTVTRPGIAAIASALLVEMLVSILQHPDQAAAPAPGMHDEGRGDHALGIVPHQIRGFLARFQNIVIRGKSYDCCSACSERVVGAYRKDGWEFVKRALNESGFVEEISGLAEVGALDPLE